jgi:hypothetical protein
MIARLVNVNAFIWSLRSRDGVDSPSVHSTLVPYISPSGSGAGLEPAAQLTSAQPCDRCEVGQWNRLGQSDFHHIDDVIKLTLTQSDVDWSGRGTAGAGVVPVRQMSGEHRGEMVDIRARGRHLA